MKSAKAQEKLEALLLEGVRSGDATPDDKGRLERNPGRGHGKSQSAKIKIGLMPRILKRPSVKRDLVDVFVYLEEHAGIRFANRFLSAAGQTMEALARLPFSGCATEDKTERARWDAEKARIEGFRNHLLFYFPLSDGIDVVRVVHAARDLDRLFEDEFVKL